MNAAHFGIYDVVLPPSAIPDSVKPAAHNIQDQVQIDRALSLRMLSFNAEVAGKLPAIFFPHDKAEFGRPEIWHEILDVAKSMAVRALSAGVLQIAPASVPDRADATAGMMSFVYPSTRPRSADLKVLLARIERFSQLARDWAGVEAMSISDSTIAAAMRVADAVERANLSLPQASPSSDGEICLSWYRDRDRFELMIDPDMHAVWATSIDRKVVGGEDVEVGCEAFPESIIGALREFYGPSAGDVSLRGRG